MTRQLAEFLLSQITHLMRFLRPYIDVDFLTEWDSMTSGVGATQFVELPGDEECG